MNEQQFPQILTVAGIDSSGGAGINADVATAFAHHVYPATVVVAVTAQNTYGVQGVELMPLAFVSQQFASIADDLAIKAVKTGMLGDASHVRLVAQELRKYNFGPIVVDPVMVAKGGAKLLADDAIEAVRDQLLPLATLVTPNIPEAEVLTQMQINSVADMQQAAYKLQKQGAQNVLIKGGHLLQAELTDVVLMADGTFLTLTDRKFTTKRTHGTGDTFAAAIASQLALGKSLPVAIQLAKAYLVATISTEIIVGHGHGPLNHWIEVQDD
ncbi:bifunctional hydroxymethylpyrimidine kinase/phosphomethylpyrimidine kinase [Periweissella cryptocerci]|uniref:Hydroxymethylpyrimidine/phosphomethylpyrimidine kinase n=1 Tax=Periweissella cryptocerci TaxID=2506420 RepID=A0A4P6YX32_9LACO|nr:bifunctional hydroxymethylpyrimidine kinase/phosphomethylpyrimidine kinase [Periweissella cryptocerci]QBO37418.1 bifunctional hydroxymethylpyrimidine kinase/phosphomethylpyrimidine kinase [Periweissella cryptocerci]